MKQAHLPASPCSSIMCSSLLIISVPLHWTRSTLSVSLAFQGAQNSSGGLNKFQRERTITSLHVLAVLLLMQPKMQLTFAVVARWPMCSSLFTQTSGPLLQSCFLAGQCRTILLHGLLPLWMHDFVSAHGEYHKSPDSSLIYPGVSTLNNVPASSVLAYLPDFLRLFPFPWSRSLGILSQPIADNPVVTD